MRDASHPASLLVLARRGPDALAGLDVRIRLRVQAAAPEWAVWLVGVQQVLRGEAQLGFWIGAEAAPGSYIVDFEMRRDPPGYRGIWRVLDEAPVAASAEGSILLARRSLSIDGRRLGSNQTWRRAVGLAQSTAHGAGDWDLQTFAERFLRHR
ncbi:MAG TPA: hypothetical protein VFE13_04545 [Caulobacteraceae bacterium]|nr:hypothetical protein [Caulobacteraceae bacterium]